MELGKIGVGVLIYNSADQIILVQRKLGLRNRGGKYELVGGAKNVHETLDEAARRECKEETSLDVELDGCFAVQHEYLEDGEWINFVYAARVVGGTMQNMEQHKHERIGLYGLDKLPANLAKGTRCSIRKWMGNPDYIPIQIVREVLTC